MCKDEKFKCTKKCESSLHELKNKLTSAPMLTLPSGSGGLLIYSDASLRGMGCVPMQHGKVVAFASRQLKRQEQNYPPTTWSWQQWSSP